jgi:hypothetical protein
MKRALSALLLLSACSEPIKIRFMYANVNEDTHGPEPLVYDLEAATGRAFEQVYEGRRGVLFIEFVDTHDHYIGRALTGTCWRSARSTYDPHVLVHEVGHLLDLKHDSDPLNFMYKEDADVEYEDMYFTDKQLDTMERSGARLNLCITDAK